MWLRFAVLNIMEAHICLQNEEPHVLSALREELRVLGFFFLLRVKSPRRRMKLKQSLGLKAPVCVFWFHTSRALRILQPVLGQKVHEPFCLCTPLPCTFIHSLEANHCDECYGKWKWISDLKRRISWEQEPRWTARIPLLLTTLNDLSLMISSLLTFFFLITLMESHFITHSDSLIVSFTTVGAHYSKFFKHFCFAIQNRQRRKKKKNSEFVVPSSDETIKS